MRTAHLLAAMVVAGSLAAGAASAAAADCIRELPAKRSEHWYYRLVNGERCWYPGSARATAGRKFKIARRAHAEKPAPRPFRPKAGAPRLASVAADEEGQAADAFAEVSNERVIPFPQFGLSVPSAAVENRASALFTDIWQARVPRRDPLVPIEAAEVARAASLEPWVSSSPAAPVGSTAPQASATSLAAAMLWLVLGIGMLGASLFGTTVWQTLRQRCRPLLTRVIAQTQHLISKRSQTRPPPRWSWL
jgi:hypothetical protein